MLEIKNLHATVDDKLILKGLDLKVDAGEVHAIMGPNGSGKSTLASVIAGREGYEVSGGEVRFQGDDLLELNTEQRAHQGLFLALYTGQVYSLAHLLEPQDSQSFYAVGSALSLVFLVAGLIASFFHLGHPERAVTGRIGLDEVKPHHLAHRCQPQTHAPHHAVLQTGAGKRREGPNTRGIS